MECMTRPAKKQYVDEHVAVTHRGEAPFTCKFCPQTFTRRRAMLMHRSVVFRESVRKNAMGKK